jgi:WD40 repeat protein
VWDVQTKRNRFELVGHTNTVTGAAFSPDEQRVITISADRTARVWELATGHFVAELRGHTDKLTSIEFSKDSAILVTGSSDTTARVWDLSKLGSFQVTSVTLKASPKEYTGLCPASVRLVGSITVAGGGGKVKYRFVRKRPELGKDEPGKEVELAFDSPGTKEVNNSYKFGGPNFPTIQGSFYLEVISPQNSKSSEAGFQISCEDFASDVNTGLAAPGQLTARKESSAQPNVYEVTVNWQAVSGAEKYTVMWLSAQSGVPSSPKFAHNIKTTSYTIKGVSGDLLICNVWAVGRNGKAGLRSNISVQLQ